MTGTALGRVWTWLHGTFPERQIYIRSQGRVQFFTFGPSLQATLAGLSLIFIGWVAFATVNVIFKDRIIAAKDHRYQQMQLAYENRVADLQTSYDELNGALVAAEDRFKSTADALESKQNAIAGFINRESQVQTMLGRTLVAVPPSTPRLNFSGAGRPPLSGDDGQASDSVGMDVPLTYSEKDDAAPGESAGSSQLFMLPGPTVPQPRAAKPARSSALGRAWKQIAAMFAPMAASAAPLSPAALAQHPGLRILAVQTERLRKVGLAETMLLARTEGNLQRGIGNLRNLIRRTGINPDQFDGRMAACGTGGPDISIADVQIQGVSDPGFTQAYLGAAGVLEQLDILSRAVNRIPLALPVNPRDFDRTSGFGPRIDPFSNRLAFHPGIDMAGPWGAGVHSTAPGTVVFAGKRGGYGTMVEIDHGNGIHTRYGHLSAATVRPGTRVGRGTAIGRVGSTGRSTGPHVHYEVWYDNVVRNPNNFIEAGRHVL